MVIEEYYLQELVIKSKDIRARSLKICFNIRTVIQDLGSFVKSIRADIRAIKAFFKRFGSIFFKIPNTILGGLKKFLHVTVLDFLR